MLKTRCTAKLLKCYIQALLVSQILHASVIFLGTMLLVLPMQKLICDSSGLST